MEIRIISNKVEIIMETNSSSKHRTVTSHNSRDTSNRTKVVINNLRLGMRLKAGIIKVTMELVDMVAMPVGLEVSIGGITRFVFGSIMTNSINFVGMFNQATIKRSKIIGSKFIRL